MRSTRVMTFAAAGVLTALVLAACGSSSEGNSSAGAHGASIVSSERATRARRRSR